ncbi:serine hydrolase domain-containing protein [Mucilaginibacter pedocola]|uniref:Beta-N-acetylglucosaminidase n=1 Tax=Mucilaginibacter pedocola TaxID=1792845 RepID=A0A1S9PC09_9SPHI|nr:serine hydrolase [Mucilaginibacter pedocola]OOQ58526.1 beta-N-acetylglucosaminidase [Mucilaginibacter pedocola]
MRKNKQNLCLLLLSGFVVFNSACAQNPPINSKNFLQEQQAAELSTVLLNNDKQVIPLQNLESAKIASIHFSAPNAATFDSLANKYTKVQPFDGSAYLGVKTLDALSLDTKFYNTLIVQLADGDINNAQILDFITTNQKVKTVIVSLLGNDKSLIKLNDVAGPLIWSAKVTPVSAMYSAEALFGGVAVTQKLTKTYTPKFATGTGSLTARVRLQYTVPEDAGIKTDNLSAIDKIAKEAISSHATPGCVVMVIKDGKVIYNKAYGYHTYDNRIADRTDDIFDVASMTKISATTMESMQLYDQGKLSLDSTAGSYLALARKSNIKTLTVREMLLHQAGLIPDIQTFTKIKPTDYTVDSSANFPTKVNDNYFLRKNYFEEVMWPDMLNAPIKTRGQYVYSDVGMCIMQQIVETVTAKPINQYVQQQFYNPLGMQTAGYLPLYRFPADRIPPTEDDKKDRHTLIDGYVHDPTAALMGGVAGHAGLFASANDIGIMYQMMLNRGSYGGVQYIKPETVDLFTSKQSAISRRGLGFDRWDPIADHKYPSQLASDQTYGHTGFTGTCVWVDPKYNLVYVFLSNRVHPDVSSKLGSLNIRPRIQDAIYEAINKGM